MNPTPTQSDDIFDRIAMRRALQLAEQGRGRVEPNPMVGAVITHGQRFVAEGFHEKFGEAHAEVNALNRLPGHPTDGLTLYVTLEPCCHQGKQPPCVQAILAQKHRFDRIVIAMQDPFDQVAGRGIEQLHAAGLQVDVGVREAEAKALNAAWLKRLANGLPWVALKWAQTIDGHIATRVGDSQWISNTQSRQQVHTWRGQVDAILVGIGTVAADDPSLTARDIEPLRIARRVVVDPTLRISPNAKLLHDDGPAVILAMREDVSNDPALRDKQDMLKSQGIELMALPSSPMQTALMDLRPLLQHLAQTYDATNVMAEGGAKLHGQLLRQQLADELRVFLAPKLLGDEAAHGSVHGHIVQRIADATRLKLLSTEQFDDDILLRYRVQYATKTQ